MLLREYGYLNFRPLPEVLREVGYRTTYFHAGDVRFDNKRRWFDRWFDEVHDMTGTFADAPRVSTWGVSDKVMYDGILDWADQQRGPFFVALMPVNNHHPWVIPDDPTFTKPQADPQSVYQKYLNTVAWSDHAMGEFVRAARAKPWGANTWFIITSDHGQAMGEHGVTNDMGGVPPYQISMRIPFVLLGPALPTDPDERKRLEAQIGSLVDIPTTVTDLLGVQAPHPWAGRSLLAPPPYEEGYAILSNPYRDNWVALRQGDLKSIHGRVSQTTWVFDLAQDPDERQDRAAEFSERVRRDVEVLDAHVDFQEHMIIYNRLWDPKLSLKRR
jgi:phosphoglycerol transferase MdoB-like AlkP superfamily enzyme